MATTLRSKKSGQLPIPSSDVPTSVFYLTQSFGDGTFEFASAASLTRYFFYCEKETVLEGAWARATTVGAAATLMVGYVESASPGADASSSESSATEIQVDMLSSVMNLTSADTTISGTIDTTVNRAPAGSWLTLEFAGANVSSTDELAVTLRVRTTLA